MMIQVMNTQWKNSINSSNNVCTKMKKLLNFLKERMNATEDSGEDVETLGEYAKENIKEDVKNITQTKDNAPQIKINLGSTKTSGIASLYEQMKGGR